MRILQGALAGFLAAAYVDYKAFMAWKSFDDVHTFNFRKAGERWLLGAATGAASVIFTGAA